MINIGSIDTISELASIQLANFIGKAVRPSRNNNSKGLATNNVSRETIRDSDYSSVSRETIIVYSIYRENTLFLFLFFFLFPPREILLDIVGYIWYNMIVMLSEEIAAFIGSFFFLPIDILI